MLKNNDGKKDIHQLYRLYQEKRDNIPSATLWSLLNTAKAENLGSLVDKKEKKESHINMILHVAKTSSSQNSAQEIPYLSLKNRFNAFWAKLLPSPFRGTQWATISAVMVIMLAIKLVPSQQQFDPYLDVAYLENCSICDQLAVSSTTKVRNIDLKKNSTTPVNSSARFGRLVLDLELVNRIAAPNVDSNNNALINTLKELSIDKKNQQLIEYFNQFDTQHIFSTSETNQVIQFLNQTFEKQADSELYHAGQWFERLRITNKSALQTQQFSSIQHALIGVEALQSKLKAKSPQQMKNISPDVLSAVEQLYQLKLAADFNTEQAQKISIIVKNVLLSLGM